MAALLVSACVPRFSYVDARGNVSVAKLGSPEGAYETLLWSSDGLIYARYLEQGMTGAPRLISLDMHTGRVVDSDLLAGVPDDDACQSFSYEQASRLDRDRIALMKRCDQAQAADALHYAYVFDTATRALTELWPGAVIAPDIIALAGRPAGVETMAVRATENCSRLGLIDAAGLRAPRLSIAADASWRFDAEWAIPDAACADVRDTTSPAYSPDGNSLVYMASRHSPGLKGVERRVASRSMIVTNLDTRAGRVVLNDVHGGALNWSPNGRFVAFRGAIGDVPALDGVFIVDVATDVAYLVSSNNGDSLDWSPDGRSLVVIMQGNQADGAARASLAVLDVSEIVKRLVVQ